MGKFNHSRAGSSTTNSCRCEEIEKKLNEAKKKLKKVFAKLDKLKKAAAKKIAKKVATLPLKAVPIFGWAMAAYDVYDVVTTGIGISDIVEQFNKEADIVNKLHEQLEECLGNKKDKKVDLDKPKSMKDKTSKEIGDDLTDKDGKHKLSKDANAEAEYAKEGKSDVDIYTKGEKNAQGTEVVVNKGEGLHSSGEKSDKPVYVKVNEPNKPKKKYVDTERYNAGIIDTADKRSEVIDINTGETISKKGETYDMSTTHDWDDETGKLTPKGNK